jgi:hypothetical protein
MYNWWGREQVIDCFICIYIFGMRHHSSGGEGGHAWGEQGCVQIVQRGALYTKTCLLNDITCGQLQKATM